MISYLQLAFILAGIGITLFIWARKRRGAWILMVRKEDGEYAPFAVFSHPSHIPYDWLDATKYDHKIVERPLDEEWYVFTKIAWNWEPGKPWDQKLGGGENQENDDQ